MVHLHQVIAIERGVVADTDKRLAEIRHILAIGGDSDPLTGISRTYESRRGEEGDQLPEQSRKVQLTCRELLEHAQDYLTRLFDLKFTREYANCSARADIVVEGVTLVANVPAGFLLYLENQLTALITTLIDRLPALDPAEEWLDDPALEEGVWRSAAREKERTRKVMQVQVLSPAQVIDGQKFDPQVRPYETDVIEGYWTTVKFSGQLPARDIQAMRARAVRVLEAVKYAREQANTITVTDREAGEALLGYIIGG